jgi:Subtilase family
VALRVPRPLILTAAIGLAMAWTAVGSVPALADQVRQQQWWLGALHVTQAQRTTTGSGVTIALLDTGVDRAQPDLTGSVITGPDLTKSGERPGQPFFGVHGTAMASLIVGHGHGAGGADGVLGVAPGAKLLSVRVVLDANDPAATDSAITSGLPAAIAAGIRYAVSSGAQVIDLPLDPGESPSGLQASTAPAPAPGTPPSAADLAAQAAAGGSRAEQAAVTFALSKGVVLVAPAGDTGTSTDGVNFPASYRRVISVGAFDSNFIKAPFTSHQPYVTLTAAGSGMTAATPTGYATVSTTAAASAVVTGIAALIRSQYPQLTPAQVSRALTSSTVFRRAGGLTDGSGHGTADAEAALQAAAKIANPVPPQAGAGAVSRTLPAAPSVPFIDQGLGRTLLRDALISLAVLIVLLLPIAVYVLVRRRRRTRAGTPALADRELGARSAYAPASGSSQADEMLEYFAAMPAESAGTRAVRLPDSPGRGSAVAETRPGAGNGALGRLPRTPMTWAHAPRNPAQVTGAPPWEPAPQPGSDLPWAAGPAPAPAVRPPAPAAAAGSGAPTPGSSLPVPTAYPATWDGTKGSDPAAGESAWDPFAGLSAESAASWRTPAHDDAPEPAGAQTGGPAGENGTAGENRTVGEGRTAGENRTAGESRAGGEGRTAGEDGTAGEGGTAGESDEPDAGPIYVWNPSASTESFPIVPRDG